jgi:hypothetical protein
VCQQILVKIANKKFHENCSSGSRSVSCGNPDGLTEVLKIFPGFAAFFANAPKIAVIVSFVH